MKKLLTILTIVLFATGLWAQTPEGIIYQAEARDNTGNTISNEPLDVKVTILQDQPSGEVVWEALHNVTTNQFGMFVLVIGTGNNTKGGPFEAISWGNKSHFLNVQVKRSSANEWTNMGTSQFLSVPYALHAKTAEALVSESDPALKAAGVPDPSRAWSLSGNPNTNSNKDRIGTTDYEDLVFVTNNKERLRITAAGKIITNQKSLARGARGGIGVGGTDDTEKDSVYMPGDLFVGQNMSVANNLKVNKSVQVQDTISSKSLQVKDNLPDGDYIATFENTNQGNGDGINIKLGKVKTNTHVPAMVEVLSDLQVEQMRNLLSCKIDVSTKTIMLGQIVLEGVEANMEMIGGLTVGIGNLIVGFINTELNLPLKAPNMPLIPSITTFPGYRLNLPTIAGIGIPDVKIPSVKIGPYAMPSFTMFPPIPKISLSKLGIAPINIQDLSFWGIPDICMDDDGPTVLNNDNAFITFTDHTDHTMGSIRAVSVKDWMVNYLNPIFLYKLRGALKSSEIDKMHAKYHFQSDIMSAVKNYISLGVEYSSGNGDYAEWLERSDPAEIITAGDIVAVKGGKITKDLSNAEQVMAVSMKPIVLGNVPQESKIKQGNNVAFMGQIPVKIMGKVATGDYIVGHSGIPGYGRAVAPEDMTAEDYKLAVGRAWESNDAAGPKMINTVVGVHNGDFINILKRYEQKFQESERRLEFIESKIQTITETISKKNL